MNKLRIGLVGLGSVANAHLAAIRQLDSVQLIALCDIQMERARKVAVEFSAQAYSDYRDLLKVGGLDLVMVLTPASTHRAIVEAAAVARAHVFCEKPLALTVSDAQAMIDACAAAEVKLFYGSCYRYLPAVRKAREMIAAGAIGRIQLMTEQVIGGHGLEGYRQWAPIHYPIGGPGGAGISLMDHGIHLIDIFSWFAGNTPIGCVGNIQISGKSPETEYLIMSFPCGASGHLLYNAATYSAALPNEGMFSGGAGWMADDRIAPAGEWVNEPGSMAIYGTAGSLRVFHYTNALYLNTGSGPKQIALVGRPSLGHFSTQLEDCVSAIGENRAPTVGGEQGLLALSALLSIYKGDQ